MPDVIGRIIPATEFSIEEAPAWTMPTRIINIYDVQGVRRGRIVWDANQVDQRFMDRLNDLAGTAFRALPSSTSAAL